MSIETRELYLRNENDYTYPNTCLLRVLRVKKPTPLVPIELSINNVIIDPSSQTNHYWIWDMSEVRERLRDCWDNNQMIKLEAALTYTSFRALPHYSTVPDRLFQSAIFTEGLVLQLHPKKRIPRFEIDEEVYKSDVTLEASKQKLNTTA